jgi:methionyl-tRNA synthetase
MAATYLEHLDPSHLRYFYASKLTPKVDDLDLNFDEFTTKVNSDLVGKVVNLASRTARFVDRLSETYPEDEGLFAQGVLQGDQIADAYEACDYARAMRLTMALADRANEYIDRKEPWKLKKDPAQHSAMRDVCSVALNLYRQMVVYLSPVLPKLAAQSAELLGADCSRWENSKTPLSDSGVGKFKHLVTRVDPKAIERVVAASKQAPALNAVADVADDASTLEAEPLADTCTIDDFSSVDLRVARVVAAEDVPEAKKLLKLTLSLGGNERRTVFAGIKAAYEPQALLGRLVVMAANLEPRKMKFGVSEGMVVAAGPGGKDVFLLSPDSGAKPGQRVH